MSSHQDSWVHCTCRATTRRVPSLPAALRALCSARGHPFQARNQQDTLRLLGYTRSMWGHPNPAPLYLAQAQAGPRNSGGTPRVLVVGGYTEHRTSLWVCNVYLLHTVTLNSCRVWFGVVFLMWSTVLHWLKHMRKSKHQRKMALYLNLSTWEHNNEKSLYKLQVFSWDNKNLLLLLSETKDYTHSTEKANWFIGSVLQNQKKYNVIL